MSSLTTDEQHEITFLCPRIISWANTLSFDDWHTIQQALNIYRLTSCSANEISSVTKLEGELNCILWPEYQSWEEFAKTITVEEIPYNIYSHEIFIKTTATEQDQNKMFDLLTKLTNELSEPILNLGPTVLESQQYQWLSILYDTYCSNKYNSQQQHVTASLRFEME